LPAQPLRQKAFGVTSADRPAMEASRDKNYQILRDKSKTAREHADFCIEKRSWPFFIKAVRKGSPLSAGSDTSKQPEKIELFGNMLGALVFCKIDVDGNKWGRFLWDMGVHTSPIRHQIQRIEAECFCGRPKIEIPHGWRAKAPTLPTSKRRTLSGPRDNWRKPLRSISQSCFCLDRTVRKRKAGEERPFIGR
jgi:hypothetical protein